MTFQNITKNLFLKSIVKRVFQLNLFFYIFLSFFFEDAFHVGARFDLVIVPGDGERGTQMLVRKTSRARPSLSREEFRQKRDLLSHQRRLRAAVESDDTYVALHFFL